VATDVRLIASAGPIVAALVAPALLAWAAPAAGPPVVRVVVGDEVAEGEPLDVTLVLDRRVGHDVTVRVDTRSGQALAPDDYRGVHRRVTVPAGERVVHLAVPTTGDRLDEAAEDFDVRLSRPRGADLGQRAATAAIADDDPLPRVHVESATFTEPALGHRLGYTRIVLSAPSGRLVVVQLVTRNGTARAGQDFVRLHPTVVFEPGNTSEPVSVELLSDERVESAETMRLAVVEARHATVVAGGRITILDAPGG
jgi:hypothetical protein